MNCDISYLHPRNIKDFQTVLDIPKHSYKELLCHSYDKALVLPFRRPECFEGGVMTSYGEYVEESAFYEGQGSREYFFDGTEVVNRTDEAAIYIGMLHTVWGHVLTDNLKKLWFLFTEQGKRLLTDGAKIVYVAVWGGSMPKYIADIFELAGVNPAQMEKIEYAPTRFRTVYVPDNSLFLENDIRYFTSELKSVYSTISSKIPADNIFEKVYFTRHRLKNVSQKEMGEKQIAKLFEKKGYKVLSPEALTPIQQIAIVKGCKYLAVTEGSISHTAVFCSPETKVTLLRKADIINTWQFSLNELSNLNVAYVDAHYSIRPNTVVNYFGPFFMCVTKELAQFLNVKTFPLPPKYSLRYFWYILRYSERVRKPINNNIIEMNISLDLQKNVRHYKYVLAANIYNRYPRLISDKLCIQSEFYFRMGYELDLKHPKTFNEKLNWLKLYDRNPLYTTLVDKVKVKEWVANKIGKEYIIPTLGVWDNPWEIDFGKLPNKFVLKCNHNSGIGMYICDNKQFVDIQRIVRGGGRRS